MSNKMMRRILLATSLSIVLFAPTDALAARLNGRVTFIGTRAEDVQIPLQVRHARLQVRLSDSTCNGAGAPIDRVITIRSGRMDGAWAHNSANFRNAFDILMTSFLSNRIVEIVGVPNCNVNNTINLWDSWIGIFG